MNLVQRIWLIILLVAVPAAVPSPVAGQNDISDHWPQFRGPQGDGHAIAVNLPIQCEGETNLSWKTDVPGRGWSSMVIVNDKIWLTTALETQATGEERERKMAQAPIGGMSAYSKVELQAICLDSQTGEIQRTVRLFTIDDPPLIHSLNSFASPSPVADRQRVYFHFGTFGTACVDQKSGAVIWKNQEYSLDHETGPGSSPILYEGLLIFHCDGCDQQYVLALDADSGKEVWRAQRSGEMPDNRTYKKAFSTPLLVRRGTQDQLISTASNWVYGYDPNDGKELWKLSYGQLGFSNVARPVVKDGTVFVCSCFTQSKMLAIDITGEGPITDDSIKWSVKRQVPNMPSPIVVDDSVYFVSDRGIVSCLDAETGQQHWQSRLGGDFSASPLLADGKLYFGNRNGELFVVRPSTDQLQLLHTNKLDSRIMASPAAVGDALYVRTEKSLYRFRKIVLHGLPGKFSSSGR